jgi:hypothetical protein
MVQRWFVLVLVGMAGVLAAPSSASAIRNASYLTLADYPMHTTPRLYDDVRYLAPTIAPFETRFLFVVGDVRYPVRWNQQYPGTFLSLTKALREVHQRAIGRHSRSGISGGVYLDRPLSATERTRFKVVVDLYRDADVLVVAAGHPACAGLTRAQARSIATGRITRWSQVVGGASSDAIRVRYLENQTRFGTKQKFRFVEGKGNRFYVTYAPGAKVSKDGGVSAAAAGDQSIAAITSWGRVRNRLSGVCAVPLGGIAPTNDSVMNLRYPEAYRVQFVAHRRAPTFGLSRRIRDEMHKHLRSAKVKDRLRAAGLLVAGEAPTTGPVGTPGQPTATAPTVDHAGRPITTSPADAEARLVGLRLDAPEGDGTSRLAFESAGALRQLFLGADGTCTKTAEGGWTVKGGWRYPEHGGGLIARIGWFLGPGPAERIVDLPDAEPGAGYLDGTPFARRTGEPSDCT